MVSNNCGPSGFDAIAYASETLNRLLTGVKARLGRCHDGAVIMDARVEKTWLIPVIRVFLYILVGTMYSHVRLIQAIMRVS